MRKEEGIIKTSSPIGTSEKGKMFLKHVVPSMLPLNHGCNMAFPAPFLNRFSEYMREIITLEGRDGNIWHVSLKQCFGNKGWRFSAGWLRFATEFGLEEGDVICFRLISYGHFKVYGFDQVGMEKEEKTKDNSTIYPSRKPHLPCIEKTRMEETTKSQHCSEVERKNIKISGDIRKERLSCPKRFREDSSSPSGMEKEENKDNSTISPSRKPHPPCIEETRMEETNKSQHYSEVERKNIKISGDTRKERLSWPKRFREDSSSPSSPIFYLKGKPFCVSLKHQKLLHESFLDAIRFSSNKPFARFVLTGGDIHGTPMLKIPNDFAKGGIPSKNLVVSMVDSDSKEWQIRWLGQNTKRKYLSGGWKIFVNTHKLMEGDVCVFELIATMIPMPIIRAHFFRDTGITPNMLVEPNHAVPHYPYKSVPKICRESFSEDYYNGPSIKHPKNPKICALIEFSDPTDNQET